jgi:ATP-dependent DNA ligase
LARFCCGHYADGRLRYAGKVGTGFTEKTLRELSTRLAPLRRTSSPDPYRISETRYLPVIMWA